MRVITEVNDLDGILLSTDTFDRKHLPAIKAFLRLPHLHDYSAAYMYSASRLSSAKPIEGNPELYTGYGPCHVGYTPNESTDFTANIFTRQVNKKFSKFYLDYILSDESPWRSVLGSSIVLKKDDVPKAILFPDMSVNAHVLTNFLIASRMPAYWFNAEPFYYLVNHYKFSKEDALLISLNFYFFPGLNYEKTLEDVTMGTKTGEGYKKNFVFDVTLRGWCSGDMPSYQNMDVERFRQGDPIIIEEYAKTFKEGAKAQPCNHIWGGRRALPPREKIIFSYRHYPYEDVDIFGFVERKLVDPDSPAIRKIKKEMKNGKREIDIAKPGACKRIDYAE